ncbi:MAG: precorrin-6y C5,15-methyltransferase (decarboxylating) subunit CbiE [Bacteroidaceae bacterium]|nr:precorrin-6y C5,15-methyltransferase (decarboxylating) subunit CbiE [Bacteroidaceae bacterium]
MRFIVIGITDSPTPYFPPEVSELIRGGHIFSGGKRHHDLVAPFLPADALWIDIKAPVEAVVRSYEDFSVPSSMSGGSAIIIFASGDPLFFGFANTLRRLLPGCELVVFPSFNSLQLLAHRLLLPYHDLRIVSLTGRPWPEFDRILIQHAPKIGVLTDREHTPSAIARRMLDYGYTGYTMHVGEHLGNPLHELVTSLPLAEAVGREFGMPNCLILESLSDGAEVAGRALFGIPDAAFSLLDGREKMITKMPIRLLTLQHLDLPRRHVLWDIGACTGSISIEARLLFPHLHIEAFEIRPECEAIITENARRFGAPGIILHIGDFCSLCSETDATCPPDAIFIGGHGGRLKTIMAKALEFLTPDGVIVMNSVSPRSQQLFAEACAELHLTMAPPVRIALNDYNPITILKCRR